MQRLRRLAVIERTVPYLAALVGLVGLAGAVVAQLEAESRTRDAQAAVTQLEASITALGKRDDALAAADNDGIVDGLLALQQRIAKLETQPPVTVAAAPAPDAAAAVPDATSPAPLVTDPVAKPAAKPMDPNLPTKDCIPLGTRFMATPNESYAICQSTQVVKVGAIGADSVNIQGAGDVVETGFASLAGGKCTIMVFSADAEGFAELRVTCSG